MLQQRTKDIIEAYNNMMPIPDILDCWELNRNNLRDILSRHNVPDRKSKRATVSKSITIEHKGQIKTYPNVTTAAKHTGIPTDFLQKLKSNQNFCISKYANDDVILVHDYDRLKDLERIAELVGMIFYSGSFIDKYDYGEELKNLIYDLGYANEIYTDINTLNLT